MNQFKDKESFLNLVCQSVRAKNLHKKIRKELSDHIEDQTEAYITKEGMDENQALIRAIEDMGDPLLVGKELNEAHKPLVEWSVLITTVLFLLISAGMQYLFSITESPWGNAQTILFSHFLLYAPIGIAIFGIAYFFNYTLLSKYSWLFYILYILLMIIAFISSPVVNGAIYYAYFSFPSLLFIPIFSGLVHRLSSKGYLGILLSGVVCLPAIFMTLLVPSISKTLIIIISCLIVLTTAIRNGLFSCNIKAGLGLVYIPTIFSFIIGFFILIAQVPYRLERFMYFINQHPDPKGLGYQTAIAREIISNAKPIGSILIKKQPIEALLPAWNSDFSFTFLIGKLGYVPAIVVVVLILFLLYRLHRISTNQNNILGKLVSLGCLSVLALQFICSILYNLGFYSIITQTPPFLSYGSISFAFTMGLLGLMLSVYRRSNIVDTSLQKPGLGNNFKSDIVYFEDGKLIINFNNIRFLGKQ